LIGVIYLWGQGDQAIDRDNRDEIMTIIFNKSIIRKKSLLLRVY